MSSLFSRLSGYFCWKHLAVDPAQLHLCFFKPLSVLNPPSTWSHLGKNEEALQKRNMVSSGYHYSSITLFLDAYKEISYFFKYSSEILKIYWWLHSPLAPLVHFNKDVFPASSFHFFTFPSLHVCSNPTIVSIQISSDKFWWSVIKIIRTWECVSIKLL